MKLKEIYNKDKKPLNGEKIKISFEVFPPKNGEAGFEDLFTELEILKKYNPSLVSLTYGAGGSSNDSMKLTEALCRKFNLMPHFTCVRSSKDEVAHHIKEIETLGIENILALRGDIPEDKTVYKKDFKYANELVSFIREKTDLSIGVAGYPEGHIDAPDIYSDIENLKKKVDAGAQAIFTQLFYDNEKFFHYIELVRNAGITLPIIAGIMPILSIKQMTRITSMAKISIPEEIKNNLEKFKDSPEDLKSFGIDYVSRQCEGLIGNSNIAGLHFYTLNKAFTTSKILENIL